MLGGGDALFDWCNEWVAWIWTPRLVRYRRILVRDDVVPFGCDQVLSSFVWCKTGILSVCSKLFRTGCVVVGPSAAKVMLVPDSEGAEGKDKECSGTCNSLPDSFTRFHAGSVLVHGGCVASPKKPSSATQPAARHDGNRYAQAGFAAAHG